MDSHTFRRSREGRKERENSSGNAKATDQISMDAFQSGSLHTNFSLVCNDLWFVACSGCGRFARRRSSAGGEKKLFEKAPHDRFAIGEMDGAKRKLSAFLVFYSVVLRVLLQSPISKSEIFEERRNIKREIRKFTRPSVSFLEGTS